MNTPREKKEWPDGVERILDGAIITYGPGPRDSLPVYQTPSEVREIMKSSQEDMIELNHHADPEVPVYVDKDHIRVIDARWKRFED